MYEPSDEENHDPKKSQQNASRSSTPTKQLVLPKEFFEYVGDPVGKNSSQYKCLFPGCAKKKDQSDKLLVISNTSRHNAKRHYLSYDPKDELGHEKFFISTKRNEIITQEDLDNWVLVNFIIVDALPISIVEKPGFKKLVSSVAPTLILQEALHKEYDVVEKLRGSTTDSGSNFLKAFRESGEASTVPNYEDHQEEKEEEEEEMAYFVIGEIINARITEHNCSNNHDPTLSQHRRCACHLLSLIANADVLKIQDPGFQHLRKLQKLQDDPTITHCQPLITGLLDAIHFRFQSMFADNELRLATITNPHFKLSWLENEDEIRRAKTLLKGDFYGSDDSSDGTSSSLSDPSSEKKRKHAKNFVSSITKRNAETLEIDEVESYLQLSKTFEDLKNFPTIMKMYKQYNVTLPSSAAVERLFSQGGLIFTSKRLQLTENHFEMLLFLKVNNNMSNKW
ncbi:uncharacterized protein LOC116924452 [Daphnia magna]|uniref:uncharacterized protein LOC116924452 n=1 Tax=Daphnia magna TaxID=35525 RepID=UPI001E1BBC29|nr:uncharacterized protein LOC116924452 [Daphnia magna]